jgi:hypothetical protein
MDTQEELIKTVDSIDIAPILEAYHLIESDIIWSGYDHKGKQAGLQHLADEDPWTSAVGRSRGRELEYTHLNPYFAGTCFEEIINRYKFKRTRLMWVGPYACYSMHRDTTPRVHIPLITNAECYFVFKDGPIQHLEAGTVHWTDTRFRHTFMNCSDVPRLHLVGAVEKWIY